VDEQVARAVKERPDADLHDVEAVQLDAGRLAELTGASLFASSSVAVVRDLGSLPADLFDTMLALAANPPEDTALVLVHAGGQKGRGLLDKIKKTKPTIIDNPVPKPRDLIRFVQGEVKAARIRMSEDAIQFLIDAVGHDLRSLAAAVAQLAADRDRDEEITIDLARRYFGGRWTQGQRPCL
jgi:DNA polymerase-3 subunit delta